MGVLIQRGARGPAVEDIQRRLLKLGYDLGRSGVDGVFLGATLEAIRAFQREHGIAEDGVVGDETWSALVDATFSLGDRLLYLRLPYLHGGDVVTLQSALNVLGFACGDVDGIFGPCTEHAVREFQANTGQPADGVVGDETVRALMRLRHVWEGKDPSVPAELKPGMSRPGLVLRRHSMAVVCQDGDLLPLCERIVNLVLAVAEDARVQLVTSGETDAGFDIVLRFGRAPDSDDPTPVVRVDLENDRGTVARMATAFAARSGAPVRVRVAIGNAPSSDADAQRLAVLLVDALCAAVGQSGGMV